MSSIRRARALLSATLLITLVALGCSSDDEGDAGAAADAPGAPAAAAAQPGSGLMVDADVYSIKQEFPLTIEFTSTVFNRIRRIPIEYTCTDNYYYPESGFAFRYGEDKSPPLAWTNAPDGTVSFAIIFDDPDSVTLEIKRDSSRSGGGTRRATARRSSQGIISPRVHWVIWNIPADVTELLEHVVTTTEALSIGPNVRQGTNDYLGIGYAGPCPPPNIQAISSNKLHMGQKPHKYSFRVYALDTVLDLAASANKNDLLVAMDGHILAAGELDGEYVNKILYK